jgi:hypothetical protein
VCSRQIALHILLTVHTFEAGGVLQTDMSGVISCLSELNTIIPRFLPRGTSTSQEHQRNHNATTCKGSLVGHSTVTIVYLPVASDGGVPWASYFT